MFDIWPCLFLALELLIYIDPLDKHRHYIPGRLTLVNLKEVTLDISYKYITVTILRATLKMLLIFCALKKKIIYQVKGHFVLDHKLKCNWKDRGSERNSRQISWDNCCPCKGNHRQHWGRREGTNEIFVTKVFGPLSLKPFVSSDTGKG